MKRFEYHPVSPHPHRSWEDVEQLWGTKATQQLRLLAEDGTYEVVGQVVHCGVKAFRASGDFRGEEFRGCPSSL